MRKNKKSEKKKKKMVTSSVSTALCKLTPPVALLKSTNPLGFRPTPGAFPPDFSSRKYLGKVSLTSITYFGHACTVQSVQCFVLSFIMYFSFTFHLPTQPFLPPLKLIAYLQHRVQNIVWTYQLRLLHQIKVSFVHTSIQCCNLFVLLANFAARKTFAKNLVPVGQFDTF